MTVSIIEPPPRNGGIAAEQLAPAPQHADAGRAAHLVAGEGDEVHVEVDHVDRQVRHRLRASSSTSAPTSRARAVIREVALTVPRMFDLCTSETILVRSLTSSSRSDSSSRPSSVRRNQRSVAPVRSQSSCHGTMFEWCSISEITISSPGPSRNRGSASGRSEAFEKRVRHQVDRLGGVLGEHHLVGAGRADERGDLRPGALVRLGRLGAERVHRRGPRWRCAARSARASRRSPGAASARCWRCRGRPAGAR